MIDSSLAQDGASPTPSAAARRARRRGPGLGPHLPPGLANDNLSGMAVAALSGGLAGAQPAALSYRLLFDPVTIGSIAWLRATRRRRGSAMVWCWPARGPRPAHLQAQPARHDRGRRDRAAHGARADAAAHEVQDFSPYGYDERQFCSPGFDLPVGWLMRTPNGEYPEYHTSADNLDFITPEALEDSLASASRYSRSLRRTRATEI